MREVKGVSFNLKERYEIKLYNFAKEQGSFSKYVKRLIQMDMEGVKTISKPVKKTNEDLDSFC
ncbi:hypothetical protein RAH41_08265 [Gottfriedia acidiceleris]|uniref:hypothetical protein n=1 Tax=Gottfriedia acidiceleris TaxID=371036 RepID=UPI002F26CCE7